ncbi:hypothetical protein CEXT_1961 [Caerostris extrusa]|uniref:Uncharacterized protein n=1 Tax=Caerostris extrusa TaxID=172846 RepID=A0AAV4Q301_CAEEX|nr:hypothetical protein CEXT_1961 [Caerostris extrusa]
MFGRGEPPGLSETMDLSPSGDEENVFPRRKPFLNHRPLPQLMTEVTDEYLYADAEELVKIIQLKARLATDWIRPAACKSNPELAAQYD